MAQLLIIVTVALSAVVGGTWAAGPGDMIQEATACFGTLAQNSQSMATSMVTGSPFGDKKCFVECAVGLLGPWAGQVGKQVSNAIASVPPPFNACTKNLAAGGAGKNSCQKIIEAGQCFIGQGMALMASASQLGKPAAIV